MYIKKILIGFLVLFVVLIIAAAAVPVLFKDKIVVALKTSINKNVNAKVNFNDLDLSVFRSFPNVSLGLSDLTVVGIDSFATDTLANIKKLNVDLDIMSVIRGEKYQVNSIHLQDPSIYARVLKSGKANWDILKEDTTAEVTDTTATTFKAAIQEYSLENARIIYDDASMGFFMDLDSVRHTGNGDFTQDLFTLKTSSEMKKLTIKYGGIPYLNKVLFKADLPIEIDMKQMKFAIGENEIQLNELLLSVVGSLAMPNDTDITMDVKFNAQESDLKNFLSLVPAIYSSSFKDMQASGKFAFNGNAKGTYNETSLPAFDVNLSIEDGRIKYPGLPSAINNIQVKTNISNPDGVIDHTIVNVPSFHVEFGKVPIDGRLLVKTPDSNPFIDMALKGKLDLKQLTAIFPMKGMTLSGIVDADVKGSGNKSSLDKGQYQQFKMSGYMIANNFNYSGESVPMPVQIPSAKMTFNTANITLNNLSAQVGKSDFQANGTIGNYLDYALVKNSKLEGNFKVNSRLVDINNLMGPPQEASKEDTSALSVIEVPANIDFRLGVNAERVIYDNLDIRYANGTLLVKDQTIEFQNVAMNMLDGRVNMNGAYSTVNAKKPKVNIDFGIDKMSIQKAFQAFNTVKLLAPVAKFTSGVFSTNLKFNSDLGQNMMPVYSSINSSGFTNIIHAIVEGFEPLNKLSSALNVDSLRKLELKNVLAKFNIEDGKLKVAPFNIKKDKFLMNVQGSNGLDQSINYQLGINVPREYLGKKANETSNALLAKFNSKAGTSVDLGETIKVNATIGGTILKPTVRVSFDETKSAVKDAVGQVVADKKAELESKAKQEVSAIAEKSKEKVQQKADTLKEQVKAKAADEVKNKINNLFKKKKVTDSIKQ